MTKVQGKVGVVTIGDIHFGVHATERIYEELVLFKNYIIENADKLDMVAILGDYFEKGLALESRFAEVAIMFFNELTEICLKHNIALRMVHGTLSHEKMQIRNFESFNLEGLDIRFFYKVTEEDFKGIKILWMPEEYIENVDEYYGDFYNRQYHFVGGHGAFDFCSFGGKVESRNDIKTAPILSSEKMLKMIPNGLCIFGHIHGRTTFRDPNDTTKNKKYRKVKIAYPGAYSRWDFNELSPRGWSSFIYDIDTQDYNLTIHDNTLAPSFGDVVVSKLKLDDDETLEAIKAVLDEKSSNFSRVRINLSGLSSDKIAILKAYYKTNPNVKIETESKKEAKLKKNENKELIRFSYIVEDKLPLNSVVKRYITDELKYEITEKRIIEILTPIVKEKKK